MNQAQRKYLIDKISGRTREKISELKSKKKEYPNASNFIFKAILSDKLELRSNDHILGVLKQRALSSKEGANWLTEDRNSWENKGMVKLRMRDLIVIPDDFDKMQEEVKAFNEEIDNQIAFLQSQLDTIELRIQLASDKTLQKMINEVDDMGELSLIDTKLKLLS